MYIKDYFLSFVLGIQSFVAFELGLGIAFQEFVGV